MRRSGVEVGALLVCLASACAWDEGQAWGVAEVSLAVRFAPPVSRLVEGRLRTARDYALRIDTMDLEVREVSLALGADAGAAFDPANPPEGFGLCHGGHCHADDGRLVPYSEVAATGGSGGSSLVRVADAEVALSASPAPVPLEACPEACELLPGDLVSLRVGVTAIRVRGESIDLRPDPRLPEDGLPFDLDIPLGVEVAVPLTGAVGDGEPLHVGLAATLSLTPRAFDAIDFADPALASGGALPSTVVAAVATAIRDHSTLEPGLRRH